MRERGEDERKGNDEYTYCLVCYHHQCVWNNETRVLMESPVDWWRDQRES